MAGTPTPNYNLPTYASDDAPDLLSIYNSAMVSIDTILKELSDKIDTVPETIFTVADLAGSGVTSGGIVVNSTPPANDGGGENVD